MRAGQPLINKTLWLDAGRSDAGQKKTCEKNREKWQEM